jgi:hypothetical protein
MVDRCDPRSGTNVRRQSTAPQFFVGQQKSWRYVSALTKPKANPRDGSRPIRFLVKAPYTDPEIGTSRPRARPCARQATDDELMGAPNRSTLAATSSQLLKCLGLAFSCSDSIVEHLAAATAIAADALTMATPAHKIEVVARHDAAIADEGARSVS